MPSPASRCWFLVVSAALFAAWIGYLAYLVLETARPTIQFWPPRITKTQPIILSRPQFLVSTLDVIADVQQDDGRPDAVMRIESVHWPADERDRFAHRTITVSNLAGCAGWRGPGRYIVPLVKNDNDYQVAGIPPSPGFDGAGPRIYPATSETERQLEEIQKPEPGG